MGSKLIKVSAHLEQMKFGRAGDPEYGIRLSYSESRALFAVQKLLDRTDYSGNANPIETEGYTLPVLEIRVRDYLSEYGVRRHVTKRGKLEFSSEGRKVAMGALESLASKTFHVSYERRDKNAKTAIDVTYPLIELTKEGSQLTILPAPILIDQIHEYYILKPDDLYETTDQGSTLFVEYLIYHQSRKRVRKKKQEIRVQLETLAAALRLQYFIDNRKHKELRKRLIALYDKAKAGKYLIDYQVDQPGRKVEKVDILSLPAVSAKSTSKRRRVYQRRAQAHQRKPIDTGVL